MTVPRNDWALCWPFVWGRDPILMIFFFAESVKKAYCEQIKILHFQLKTYIELLVQKLYAAAKPSTSPSQYCQFGLFQCFNSCFKCFVTSFIAMYSPACNNYISHGKWNGMNLHPTTGFLKVNSPRKEISILQKTNLKLLIFDPAYWGRNFSFIFC